MAKMNSRVDFIENKIHIIEEKISIFEDKLKMMMDMFSLMKQNIDTLHTAVQHSTSQQQHSSFMKPKLPSNMYRRSYHGEPLSPSDSEVDSPMSAPAPKFNPHNSSESPEVYIKPSVQIVKTDIPRSRCAI